MYVDRYFFTWLADRDTRISGGTPDSYECIIQQLDYTGASEELQAQANPVQINYQNTGDNVMQAIRGSEATLNLIATASFQLEDLYTENEREFLVLIYRNSSVIWRGFIIPDGCQEQFMFDPYGVSINAVDTLGLLKNLSYVQNDGNFWLGKQSFLEIIYNCLNRIEIPDMDLYTCVNIYETNQTQGDSYDPLALTFTQAERYLKEDGINPINCEEVLNAVLQEWTATIIQSDGDFYVFRTNELALSASLTFRKYTDGLPTYDGFYIQKNLSKKLGGESEGAVIAPLFHIHSDQLKMIVKPYKNASMSYKYGENKNLEEKLTNPTLTGAYKEGVGDPIGPRADIVIPGWTRVGTIYAGISLAGNVIFYPTLTVSTSNYYQNDTVFAIGNNFRLRLTVDYTKVDPLYYSPYMNFQIIWNDGLTNWYLQADYSWASVLPYVDYFSINSEINASGQLVITSAATLSSGTITIRILSPSNPERAIIYTNISASVYQDLTTQVGEIHTATQTGTFTHVPDTIDVFNGDSTLKQYMGAMYLADLTTLTAAWNRRGLSESILALPYEASKDFLRIAVEEIQRMHAGPYVRFEGSIFGYFPPLSRFVINLITGNFMPLSLSYDLQDNVCKAVLARITNDEIAMDYTLEPDYGETTKVTVNQGP